MTPTHLSSTTDAIVDARLFLGAAARPSAVTVLDDDTTDFLLLEGLAEYDSEIDPTADPTAADVELSAGRPSAVSGWICTEERLAAFASAGLRRANISNISILHK